MVVTNARWEGQASLRVFLFRSFSFPLFGGLHHSEKLYI